MRSSRRTATAAAAALALEAGDGPPSGAGASTLEMDPWKEDRVRDFVAVNTIQRLRAYHLAEHAPMPPLEAVNVARARNLILLPRATPDYRPCQGEKKPSAAALRQRRRRAHSARVQARRARQAARHPSADDGDDELASVTSSTCSESSLSQSSSSSSSSSSSPSADSGAHPAQAPFCSLEKARVAFFGAASFTSSASPHRLLASPHVPATPSRSQSARVSAHAAATSGQNPHVPRVAEGSALAESADTPRAAGDADADILANSTPLKAPAGPVTATASDTPVLRAWETTEEGALSPSPHKLPPSPCDTRSGHGDVEASGTANSAEEGTVPLAFDGQRYGCEVCEALHQYFQSLLTRGVVLDRFNHKDLAFAWWVIGRNMDTAALEHVGPLRREPLLISLRNHYFSLLTKHEAKRRTREQRRAAAAAAAATATPREPSVAEDSEAVKTDLAAATGDEPHTDPEDVAPPAVNPPAAGTKRRRAEPSKSTATAKTRRKASPARSPSASPSRPSPAGSRSRSPALAAHDDVGGRGRPGRASVEQAPSDGVTGGPVTSHPPPSRASSTASTRRTAHERRLAVEDTWSSVRSGRRRPTSSTTSLTMPDAADSSQSTPPTSTNRPKPTAEPAVRTSPPATAPSSKASAPASKAHKKAKASTGAVTTLVPPSPPATATSVKSTAKTSASTPKAPAAAPGKKSTAAGAAAPTAPSLVHAAPSKAARAAPSSATTTATTVSPRAVGDSGGTPTPTPPNAPPEAPAGTTSRNRRSNDKAAQGHTAAGETTTEVSPASSPTAQAGGDKSSAHVAPAPATPDPAQGLAPFLLRTPFQARVEARIQQRLADEDSLYSFLMGSATHQRDAKGRPLMPKPTAALSPPPTSATPAAVDEEAPSADTTGTAAGHAKGRRGRHRLTNKGAVDPSLFASFYRYDHDAFAATLEERQEGRRRKRHRDTRESESDDRREEADQDEAHVDAVHTRPLTWQCARSPFAPPLSCRYDKTGQRFPMSFVPADKAEVLAPPRHVASVCLRPLPEPPHTLSFHTLPYAQQCLLTWEAATRIEEFAEAQAERERQKAALLSTMRMTTRRMRASIVENEPHVVAATLKKGHARRDGPPDAAQIDGASQPQPWQAAGPRLGTANDSDDDEEEEEDDEDTSDADSSSASSNASVPQGNHTVMGEGNHCASQPHTETPACPPARCFIDYWASYRSA